MLENFFKTLDKGRDSSVLLADLSKAFDCIAHDLNIAKLHGYGFVMPSLKIMNAYLTNRHQEKKTNNS